LRFTDNLCSGYFALTYPEAQFYSGHELLGLAQEENLVSLQFSNSNTRSTSVVLGADGIHSVARRCLFPEAKLRYSGQTSWRAVVGFEVPTISSHKSLEIWAPGARFGYSAVSPDQVYWYATVNAPPGQSESSDQTKERLIRMAEVFPPPILDLVSATPREAIFRTDLWDLPGLTTWHRRRVMLLGDAAHAATPNLGQGGAQAMEDAWTLARELADTPDVSRAFLEFERRRLATTQSVVRMAWRLGKAAHLSGFGRVLRNSALRAMPDAVTHRQIDALYNSSSRLRGP
jgi:2-polyprenyl-6-methoxyphenol hydroxylase-like FAD-dependent oxidoreductase